MVGEDLSRWCRLRIGAQAEKQALFEQLLSSKRLGLPGIGDTQPVSHHHCGKGAEGQVIGMGIARGIAGALLGAFLVSMITDWYYRTTNPVMHSDGQYALIFLFTIPVGAVIGAIIGFVLGAFTGRRRASGEIARSLQACTGALDDAT